MTHHDNKTAKNARLYKPFSAMSLLNILGAVSGREVHVVLHVLVNFYFSIDVPF